MRNCTLLTANLPCYIVHDSLSRFSLWLLAQPTISTGWPIVFLRWISKWTASQDSSILHTDLLDPLPNSFKICYLSGLSYGWRVHYFVIPRGQAVDLHLPYHIKFRTTHAHSQSIWYYSWCDNHDRCRGIVSGKCSTPGKEEAVSDFVGLLLTCKSSRIRVLKGRSGYLIDNLLFKQGIALFWSLTGVGLARRNHIPILVPDDRYFRSVFGQASLVVLFLVPASQLVSLISP